jgi:DNA repair photolyase
MIREIQAKRLLGHITHPDDWFGTRYNMNLYRGCQHHCIYCDSRSECYGIEDFDGEVLVKVNALELLPGELASKREKGLIGFGSMSDPYTPAEIEYNLTGRALAIIAQHRFPLHLITKSDRIVRDIDVLEAVNEVGAWISFTLTTVDDDLAALVEPGAPRPSRRLEAMAALAERGIHVGVTLMPVLPWIEDNTENVTAIITQACEAGATHIIPAFGMTMRDRQREHFYAALDRHFPGLRARYERRYGGRYECDSPRGPALFALVERLREHLGFAVGVKPYRPHPDAEQLTLF